ncbi:MAG: hypothetical protein AAF228_06420 [Pseudomonadota bacterium]
MAKERPGEPKPTLGNMSRVSSTKGVSMSSKPNSPDVRQAAQTKSSEKFMERAPEKKPPPLKNLKKASKNQPLKEDSVNPKMTIQTSPTTHSANITSQISRGGAPSHAKAHQVEKVEATKQIARRRPAGPARARIAANDDRPSIGGLIFSLQQKPSQRPYTIAMISSGIWMFLGLLLSWSVVGEEISRHQSLLSAIASPQTIIVLAVIIVPISLFWFLALLIIRAQELRLMSSAMTEVAVRLAEPDRMAEQKVASLGQTVRRQVAAMNDAISRSLGRAGELEALVHNEVTALERSYSENELRIRGLLQELASEREALTNNSERVSDVLNNIGLRVAQDVSHAGERVTKSLKAATDSLADSLATKGEKVTSAINSAGMAIDEKLAERGSQITKQIVTQGIQATERLEQAGAKVNSALQESTDRTTALVTSRGNSLLKALSSMNDRIRNELPNLLESLGGEQIRLSKIIEGAVKNLAELELSIVNRSTTLENTLGARTKHLETVLSKHLEGIDKAVMARAKTLDASMLERTKMLDAAFSQRVEYINKALDNQTAFLQNTLQDRTKAIEVAMANQSTHFDKTFTRGVEAFRQTTENLTSESIRTIEALAGQSEMLKHVSEGLLTQVHNLINRFESRGTSFMQAAHSLENSQFKIDSVLENRQSELNTLLDTISVKADQLDTMMKSYSSRLEGSLNEAQKKASELTHAISTGSEVNSKSVLQELEKLREDTQHQTEHAMSEMRQRFTSITQEVAEHIHTLSDNFSEVTTQLKDQTTEVSSRIDETHNELRDKVNKLPNIARESSEVVKATIKDQLHAINSLSEIAAEHNRSRDVSSPTHQHKKLPNKIRADLTKEGNSQLPAPPAQQQNTHVNQTTTAINHSAGQQGKQLLPPKPPSQQHMPGQILPPPVAMKPPATPPVPPQINELPRDPSIGHQAGGNSGMMGGGAQALVADDNGKWSLGDLLQRASQPDDINSQNQGAEFKAPTRQNPQHHANNLPPANMQPAHVQQRGGQFTKSQPLDMQLISQAIDQRLAAQLWQRYQSGERGIFSRNLYTPNGQLTFDEILHRYNTDHGFMRTVDRYLNDFERLLREADQKDPSGQLVQNYLTSETGRVYLLLAHASGRLG